MEIEIKKYKPTDKFIWDTFITQSKNGTFLFNRDFMEYHSCRFVDYSLLFYLKGKLIAVLPANIDGQSIYSHQGLTYGGLILSTYIKTIHVLAIFDLLNKYLLSQSINRLIYKTVPHIYHKQPSEEDLYALFRNRAKLIERSISSCIKLENKIQYSKLRTRMKNKALSKNLFIRESCNFHQFWTILDTNIISKFQTKPTHSLSEIEYLKSAFPNHIFLYEICDESSILGGCILFLSETTCHVQYISASTEGKKIGALDMLFNYIITEIYNTVTYFDFGISTENNGNRLNGGLIFQKEGFGARGIVYDTYELKIKD